MVIRLSQLLKDEQTSVEEPSQIEPLWDRLDCILDEISTVISDAQKKNFQQMAKIKEDRTNWLQLQQSEGNQTFTSKIKLDVGGKQFSTQLETLTAIGGTFFSGMFSGKLPVRQEKDGSYFIDRDPLVFSYILNFLRGIYPDLRGMNPREILALKSDSMYYQVEDLQEFLGVKGKKSKLSMSLSEDFDWELTTGQGYIVSPDGKCIARERESYNWRIVRSRTCFSKGQHYWEIFLDNIDTADPDAFKMYIGVGDENQVTAFDSTNWSGGSGCAWALCVGDLTFVSMKNFSSQFSGQAKMGCLPSGDVIGVLVDMASCTIKFTQNGVCLKGGFTDFGLQGKSIRPMVAMSQGKHSVSFVPCAEMKKSVFDFIINSDLDDISVQEIQLLIDSSN